MSLGTHDSPLHPFSGQFCGLISLPLHGDQSDPRLKQNLATQYKNNVNCHGWKICFKIDLLLVIVNYCYRENTQLLIHFYIKHELIVYCVYEEIRHFYNIKWQRSKYNGVQTFMKWPFEQMQNNSSLLFQTLQKSNRLSLPL